MKLSSEPLSNHIPTQLFSSLDLIASSSSSYFSSSSLRLNLFALHLNSYNFGSNAYTLLVVRSIFFLFYSYSNFSLSQATLDLTNTYKMRLRQVSYISGFWTFTSNHRSIFKSLLVFFSLFLSLTRFEWVHKLEMVLRAQ